MKLNNAQIKKLDPPWVSPAFVGRTTPVLCPNALWSRNSRTVCVWGKVENRTRQQQAANSWFVQRASGTRDLWFDK